MLPYTIACTIIYTVRTRIIQNKIVLLAVFSIRLIYIYLINAYSKQQT